MLYVDNVRLYTGPTVADNAHGSDAGSFTPANYMLTRVQPTKGPQNRAELLALYRHDTRRETSDIVGQLNLNNNDDNNDGSGRGRCPPYGSRTPNEPRQTTPVVPTSTRTHGQPFQPPPTDRHENFTPCFAFSWLNYIYYTGNTSNTDYTPNINNNGYKLLTQ
jgi:hypothetical protein